MTRRRSICAWVLLNVLISCRHDGAVPPLERPTRRRFAAIDVHEHAQTADDIARLLSAMDRFRIERVCVLAAGRMTFGRRDHHGVQGYEDNNEVLLAERRRHPRRLCVFVTLDPEAKGNLERLRGYVARGADGLKLYLGHPEGGFHPMELDDERLRPVYAYAEETRLPITFHVDLVRFYDDFVRLMDRFPNLRVNLPHFGLHKNDEKRLARLASLLDRYPNLYTDVSFGRHDFQVQGFEALGAGRHYVREFFVRYAHRIMFASDMVVTDAIEDDFMDATLTSYFRLLEESEFRFFHRPDQTMYGLALPDEVLEAVYRTTPAAFLAPHEK
jgi:predicted TIM-barrel fold metal-dependent hydrolase